eukprot:365135-Chlamydomonas_euryale.AAC.1
MTRPRALHAGACPPTRQTQLALQQMIAAPLHRLNRYPGHVTKAGGLRSFEKVLALRKTACAGTWPQPRGRMRWDTASRLSHGEQLGVLQPMAFLHTWDGTPESTSVCCFGACACMAQSAPNVPAAFRKSGGWHTCMHARLSMLCVPPVAQDRMRARSRLPAVHLTYSCSDCAACCSSCAACCSDCAACGSDCAACCASCA